jgi:predicted MPP superfamily phosphohydrolase
VIVFLAVALAVLGLLHLYLYRRLARDTGAGRRARRLAAVALAGLALLIPGALLGERIAPWWVAQAAGWIGYLWLALLMYLVVPLALAEPVRAVLLRLPRPRPVAAAAPPGASAAATSGTDAAATHAPPGDRRERPAGDGIDHGRRLLVGRSLAIVAGLAAAGTVGGGVRSALGPPVLRRVDIPVPGLRPGLDGFRVALVSDIHLGPLRGRAHTERIVAAIDGLDADVVTVVGDLVDGTVAQLGEAVSPLRRLRARLGSYFVTGNHEYYSGYQQWVDEVADLGLYPLRNARRDLGGLTLAGVNDSTGDQFGDPADWSAALDGRDPAIPTVLLAHQPVHVGEAARRGVEVQLSGHTHGGQMWPVHYLARAQQGYLAGLYRTGPTSLFVTRGAGFWGPPVRVGAPPEIVLVRLRSADRRAG